MKMNGTDKKMLIFVCAAVLTMFFAGCGASNSDAVEETTGQLPAAVQLPTVQTGEMPSETESVAQKPGKETGFVHSHPLGTTVYYDLDGDGIEESITVNAQEYADGQLEIGGASMEFMAINPTGYFTILNVDQSLNMLLVGISDYGFSDDDMTVLYAYDGAQITEAGAFGDILGKNSYDKAGAVCHGDGTITARVRMDILGTWTAVGLYQMGEKGLEDHTDLYRYKDWDDRLSGWEVKTKMDLVMYEDCAETGAQVAVPAGAMVRMIGVRRGQQENTHWVCFEVDSLDNTLWLPTEEIDWQTYVQTADGLINSEEAFDGFYYAG